MGWMSTLQLIGAGLKWTSQTLYAALYYITLPLHYPLYYILLFVAFLLSPFWYLIRAVSTVVAFPFILAAKLKYLYLYLAFAAIIGVLAALIAHGTSRYLFLLLGVHVSQEEQAGEQSWQTNGGGGAYLGGGGAYLDDDDGSYYYNEDQETETSYLDRPSPEEDEMFNWVCDEDALLSREEKEEIAASVASSRWPLSYLFSSSSPSSAPSASSSSTVRPSRPKKENVRPPSASSSSERDLFEQKWLQLRSSSSSRGSSSGGGASSTTNATTSSSRGGRRRGLLAQTIHEETSESDSL